MNIHIVVNTQSSKMTCSHPMAKYIAEKHELVGGKNSKLVSCLTDKKRYVIHEMNLKQAVDAGLCSHEDTSCN